MTARFNPPPGWQVPPGFRPDAGWSPDPAWPPAPPGWDYWVEDEPAAARTMVVAGAAVAPVPTAAPQRPVDPSATSIMSPISAPANGPTRSAVSAHSSATPLPAPPPPPAPPASAASSASAGGGHPVEQSTAPLPPSDGPRSRTAARTADAPPRRKRTPNAVIGGVAAACLALGIIIGAVFSMGQTSDARQAVADAQREVDAAADQQAAIDAKSTELDERAAALDERETALKERETTVAEQESALATKQQELDDQAAQQQQQQQPAQNTQWFYWSCDDARSAGAAPIQNGQPGYRGALDPNNNGLACEDGE